MDEPRRGRSERKRNFDSSKTPVAAQAAPIAVPEQIVEWTTYHLRWAEHLRKDCAGRSKAA